MINSAGCMTGDDVVEDGVRESQRLYQTDDVPTRQVIKLRYND